MISLGKNLRALRNERNLSQRKLAQRVGVRGSTIALYESGERYPSIPMLIRLAKELGVTVDYLLGVDDHRDYYLDVSGLTQRQIDSLVNIIELYRE